MTIGIIGAGHIGGTVAQLLVDDGHTVVLSNSRGPETLREQIQTLGPNATAKTSTEAAEMGDIVMEAIPFGRVTGLPSEALAGRILVTASNYYPDRDGRIEAVDDGRLTQSEWTAEQVGGARVVKAFNTIYWQHLRDQGNASLPLDDRRVIPLAGDDRDAKARISELIESIGFAPLDMGSLREGGRRMEPGAPIYNKEWTLAEARTHLAIPPA
ncbi:NADPH-dependent F420 reductase [Longibacter sp.]|jgi:predicted dinucleotide-binding enzyme|uniref:NADPH-dependent F420 reductase n=1 Tax=Longibacter sp. TaxID=2045415 RepID=UPI003EBB017C